MHVLNYYQKSKINFGLLKNHTLYSTLYSRTNYYATNVGHYDIVEIKLLCSEATDAP